MKQVSVLQQLQHMVNGDTGGDVKCICISLLSSFGER